MKNLKKINMIVGELKKFKFHFVGGLISEEGFEDLAKAILFKLQEDEIEEYNLYLLSGEELKLSDSKIMRIKIDTLKKIIDGLEQRVEDLEITLFNSGILTKTSKYI